MIVIKFVRYFSNSNLFDNFCCPALIFNSYTGGYFKALGTIFHWASIQYSLVVDIVIPNIPEKTALS